MSIRAQPALSFWGEIAPCQHVMEIYAEEGPFIESLANFVEEGFARGDAVVVIATAAHLSSLGMVLAGRNAPVERMLASGVYVPLDAACTLSRFMVDGWPDDAAFFGTIADILEPHRASGRRVRAYGEMVALLWEQGHHGSTVRLEHLWEEVCNEQGLALFCAYPRIGATRDMLASLEEVRQLHTQVLERPVG